jgi:hypothetical protein
VRTEHGAIANTEAARALAMGACIGGQGTLELRDQAGINFVIAACARDRGGLQRLSSA